MPVGPSCVQLGCVGKSSQLLAVRAHPVVVELVDKHLGRAGLEIIGIEDIGAWRRFRVDPALWRALEVEQLAIGHLEAVIVARRDGQGDDALA